MDDHGRYFCVCGYQNEAARTQGRLAQALFSGLRKQLDRLPTNEEARTLDLLGSGEGYFLEEDGTFRPLTPEERAQE
jgi:hypothetical protein